MFIKLKSAVMTKKKKMNNYLHQLIWQKCIKEKIEKAVMEF